MKLPTWLQFSSPLWRPGHETQAEQGKRGEPLPRRARRRRTLGTPPVRSASPSARELFGPLRTRLLASRPVIGYRMETFHADGSSSGGEPIYGSPVFRNVIENGRWL